MLNQIDEYCGNVDSVYVFREVIDDSNCGIVMK